MEQTFRYYGLSLENPVLCGWGTAGEKDYFLRLRCEAGKHVNVKRVGSLPSFEIGYTQDPGVFFQPGSNALLGIEDMCKAMVMVDIFKLTTNTGKSECMEIYVDMYHQGPEKPIGIPGWTIISPAAWLGELLETFATEPVPDYQGFLNALLNDGLFRFEDPRHIAAIAHTLDECESVLNECIAGKARSNGSLPFFLKWKLLIAFLGELPPDLTNQIFQMRAGRSANEASAPSNQIMPHSYNTNSSYANIIDRLERSGYAPLDWPDFTCETVRVFEKNGTSAVVILPLSSPLSQDACQQQFEAFLRDLIKSLEQLYKSFHIMDIYFPGGGTLVIPEWFHDWHIMRGICIHIFAGEYLGQSQEGVEPGVQRTVRLDVIEQRLFEDQVLQKIKKDYGLLGEYSDSHEFANSFLNTLGQTPIKDPVAASYSNKEVFEAAVRALGSNARKWSSFLANEPDLREVLMGYDPGKVITCRVSPESLMRFLPGQTAPNDSYSIIAWAHLLNAVPDYYQAVIVPVAHDLQKLNPSLLIAELLLCLVGYFGTDPNLYGVNGALGVALPEFFSKNKWCSAWGYTNADGKHINRNIICKKWKFPGMGYALGSEFMRNLKWNGFKIDRHIKRLFSRWIPVLDPIAQKRAAHLTTILGTSLPGELKEFFYYSLLGMAITPRGISYSHADNLIWALGAYVEKKGNESDIIYVQ